MKAKKVAAPVRRAPDISEDAVPWTAPPPEFGEGFVLEDATLERVSLAGLVAPGMRWRDVRLVGCDLSNAHFRGLQAMRVEFVDCRMVGLKAVECSWKHVLLERCDARYAQWNEGRFEVCEFREMHLEEADLTGGSLEGAIFSASSLDRADLTGTRLKGADLRGASIEGCLVGADAVRGAVVTPAQAIELARIFGLVIR